MFLSHFLKFNKPQDRLFAGQIDRLSRFSLRYQALVHQHARRRSPTRGLAGGRVSLIPHQLHIAREVGHRHAPRVLLADEVGLGKTIEAGMIIYQQLLSGRAQRVLILVPESLQHQWLVEMLRRFNLHFSLFDEERCIESAHDARESVRNRATGDLQPGVVAQKARPFRRGPRRPLGSAGRRRGPPSGVERRNTEPRLPDRRGAGREEIPACCC